MPSESHRLGYGVGEATTAWFSMQCPAGQGTRGIKVTQGILEPTFCKTLSVKISKTNINVINATGSYSAIIYVHNHEDVEYVLRNLSTFESQKKLMFNFLDIVPSGQVLAIKRIDGFDEEQTKERLPSINDRQLAEQRSHLSKFYAIGDKLGNETRKIEFKRASGKYMKKEMRNDVPNYLCGFPNSGVRGTLMFGILDDGTVVGVKCRQNQEDRYRRDIDCTLKEIEPQLFPQHYMVEFVQVVENTGTIKANCKVIEVTVEVPSGQLKMYQTKDGVFIRRDGSLQVLTAWSDLQELAHLRHIDDVNQLQAEFQMQLQQKERTIQTQAENNNNMICSNIVLNNRLRPKYVPFHSNSIKADTISCDFDNRLRSL